MLYNRDKVFSTNVNLAGTPNLVLDRFFLLTYPESLQLKLGMRFIEQVQVFHGRNYQKLVHIEHLHNPDGVDNDNFVCCN